MFLCLVQKSSQKVSINGVLLFGATVEPKGNNSQLLKRRYCVLDRSSCAINVKYKPKAVLSSYSRVPLYASLSINTSNASWVDTRSKIKQWYSADQSAQEVWNFTMIQSMVLHWLVKWFASLRIQSVRQRYAVLLCRSPNVWWKPKRKMLNTAEKNERMQTHRGVGY